MLKILIDGLKPRAEKIIAEEQGNKHSLDQDAAQLNRFSS